MVILPPSYVLPPRSLETDSIPFTYGGTCDVYKGTLNGLNVCIKYIRVYAQDPLQEKVKVHFLRIHFPRRHLATN